MSTLKTNNIQHVDRSEPSILINTDGSVNIAGTMTYEDVRNVDSVGIITARKQLHVGTGVSIAAGGLNITAGVSTVQALQATTGTFSGIVQSAQFKLLDNAKAIYGTGGDMEIYHNATNTVIQNGTGTLQIVNTGSDLYQQAAANITFNTNGSNERVRINSDGRIAINDTGFAGYSSFSPCLALGDSGDSQPGLVLRGSTSSNCDISFCDNSGAEGDEGVSEGLIRYEHSNDAMRFDTADSERLRITSGGVLNVPAGIGPQLRFEYQHSVTTDATISTFDDADGTLLSLGSNFYFDSSGSETRYNTSEESSGIVLNRNGKITLKTGCTGATATTRLELDSVGSALFTNGIQIRVDEGSST